MTSWRRSTACDNGCSCVWVDIQADVVRVAGEPGEADAGVIPVVSFIRLEWAAFLIGVKAGEFDLDG